MNTYKLQLFCCLFVQLFQDHMHHFFLSLVLPSLAILNVFMKYNFSNFFSAHVVRVTSKMEMQEIRRLFYLFNVTDKNNTVTQHSNTSDINKT